jgi:hypothetical protein
MSNPCRLYRQGFVFGTEFLPRAGMAADSENKLPSLGKFFRDVTRPERRDLQKIPQPGEFNDLSSGQDGAN